MSAYAIYLKFEKDRRNLQDRKGWYYLGICPDLYYTCFCHRKDGDYENVHKNEPIKSLKYVEYADWPDSEEDFKSALKTSILDQKEIYLYAKKWYNDSLKKVLGSFDENVRKVARIWVPRDF